MLAAAELLIPAPIGSFMYDYFTATGIAADRRVNRLGLLYCYRFRFYCGVREIANCRIGITGGRCLFPVCFEDRCEKMFPIPAAWRFSVGGF